jgi:hypothetical protein
MNTADLTLACERALAESMADVATELRLVNVIDLIRYVQGERCAHLEDLVNSSAELYFKPGALRYGWSADLELVWHAPPIVSLDMEFCWRGVTTFFRLRLDCERAGVDIRRLLFDRAGASGRDRAGLFAAALAESRLTPPRRAPGLPDGRDPGPVWI